MHAAAVAVFDGIEPAYIGFGVVVPAAASHHRVPFRIGKLVFVDVEVTNCDPGHRASFHENKVIGYGLLTVFGSELGHELAGIKVPVFGPRVPDDVFAKARGNVLAYVSNQQSWCGDDIESCTAILRELKPDLTVVAIGIEEIVVNVDDLAAVAALDYGSVEDHRGGEFRFLGPDAEVVPMGVFVHVGVGVLGEDLDPHSAGDWGDVEGKERPGLGVQQQGDPVVPLAAGVVFQAYLQLISGGIQVFAVVVETDAVLGTGSDGHIAESDAGGVGGHQPGGPIPGSGLSSGATLGLIGAAPEVGCEAGGIGSVAPGVGGGVFEALQGKALGEER